MADRTQKTSTSANSGMEPAHVYTNRQGQTAEERAAYEQAGPDLAQISVAVANTGHYPLLGELTVRAYEPVLADLYSGGYDHQLADVAGRAATSTIFVALFGEFVIGGVALRLGADDGSAAEPGQARIDCLAVDPSAQRLGAGRMLVEACVALAMAEGCSSVVATVAETMTGAAALLEAAGFVLDPTLDLPGSGAYQYVSR